MLETTHPVYIPAGCIPICSQCPWGPTGISHPVTPRKSTDPSLPLRIPSIRARRPSNGPYSKSSSGVCRQSVAGHPSWSACYSRRFVSSRRLRETGIPLPVPSFERQRDFRRIIFEYENSRRKTPLLIFHLIIVEIRWFSRVCFSCYFSTVKVIIEGATGYRL